MSEFSTFIASVEWIVLGLLFLHILRKWNRKFSELYDDLKEEIKKMEYEE